MLFADLRQFKVVKIMSFLHVCISKWEEINGMTTDGSPTSVCLNDHSEILFKRTGSDLVNMNHCSALLLNILWDFAQTQPSVGFFFWVCVHVVGVVCVLDSENVSVHVCRCACIWVHSPVEPQGISWFSFPNPIKLLLFNTRPLTKPEPHHLTRLVAQ